MLVYLSDITRREMELARKIQNRIVKGYQWCRSESFELVGFSAMARGVGGDFYVFRELGPGRWFIALCDVSGKGISAALVTAMLSGMINSFDFRAGVGGFVERLNRTFNETFVQERFLTGMFLELDIPSGRLRLFDMGHSHGALFRGGRLQTLRSRAENVPIGVSQELRPQAASLKLRKGDILLLFSDGLVDQTDERGASYPLSRLQGLLGSPEGLEQLKIRLLEDFHHFRGNMHQLDDITFLLLRFNGEPING
jgi:sigma-B regulation protein RsbU (phosphoserine phosphatase)